MTGWMHNKENQIGCGYCANEQTCKIHDPKVNKAKLGCENWKHWQDSKCMICRNDAITGTHLCESCTNCRDHIVKENKRTNFWFEV